MSDTQLTADQDAQDAQELLDALEERIREGDETIGPDELESARGLAMFAMLRVEAAERKAERQRQQEERDQIEAAVRDSVERARQLTAEPPTADFLEQAIEAVKALVEGAKQAHELVAQVMRDVHYAESQAARLGLTPPSGYGVRATGEDLTVEASGKGIQRVLLGDVTLRAAVLAAFGPDGAGIATFDMGGHGHLIDELKFPHFPHNQTSLQ